MQPVLWQQFLTDFTRLVGLPGAALLHQDLAREKYSFGVAVGVDPVASSLYAQYYGQMDAWRPNFLVKEEGELAFGDELCAPTALKKTEFYGDYVAKYGITLQCAVATVKRPTSFELLSVYRGLHDAPPGPDVQATIDFLIPHIRQALRIRQQMSATEVVAGNFTDVIESLTAGVILLNDRNECIFVNRRAEKLCAANDGIYIRHARLGAHAAEDHQLLYRLIEGAVAVATGQIAKPCGVASIQRQLGPPLTVSAVSLSHRTPVMHLVASQAARVAIFLRTSDDELLSLPQLLISMYGLTGAEARLSRQLFEGCSLTQAAERNRVSRETVRAQLRTIFCKTHVRRQADLVRLFSQLLQTV
jgi:DNA-binding CsgD family transcriptional regulator/PAS domain-containing protein